MNDLTFFTVSSNKYNNFILPFIYFANKYNPNSNFEIIINDKIISNNILEGKDYLISVLHNSNILLKQQTYNIPSSALRFLLEPTNKSNYTYISDIDIMICEEILNFHKHNLFNNIYNNATRKYVNKPNYLSGLHFVKTNDYYNKTKNIRNDILNNKISMHEFSGDENLLYEICIRSNITVDQISGSTTKLFNLNRPIHGMHLSLNRFPLKQNININISAGTKYIKNFNTVIAEPEFLKLKEFCPDFFNWLYIFKEFTKI